MPLTFSPIRRRVALAAPLVAMLILAACNGSENDPTPSTTPPPSPPPATSTASSDDTPPTPIPPDPDPPARPPTDDSPSTPSDEPGTTASDDPPPNADDPVVTEPPLDDARLDLLIAITDPQDLALLQHIGETAGERRGLPLLTDVPAFLIRRGDIDEFLLFFDDDDRQEADFIQTTYRLLGILNEDTEYLALIEDLYTGLVLGFYDFDLASFVIVSADDGIAGRDIDTITHEFVHALQDQHFNLRETFESFGSNSDRTLAYQFVVEGDARLSEQLLSDIESEVASQLPRASDRLPGAGGRIPVLLERIFIAPYLEGVAAIKSIIRSADLSAIDTLLGDPPQSTEQLLHLEKLSNGELPITVSDPDAAPFLGSDWTLIQHNTLGEFFLRLLVDEELSSGQANAAAAGWGGDRIATYRSTTGDELLTWHLRWDSADEGEEFLDAMFTWLDRRSDGDATDTANATARLWVTNERSYWIQGDGDSVWITIGTRADDVFRVATALAG